MGQALDSAGYNAVPAKEIHPANELIRVHKIAVDILVIDPLLPDAFSFISALRQSQPQVRVVAAVPEDWEDLPPMTEVDAWLRKPRHLTLAATLPWVKLIQNFYSAAPSNPFKTSKLLNG